MINLIWAMDDNWLIGKDNRMPWHVKEDLLYYKEKTLGKTVFLGYNNYVSLKGYYKEDLITNGLNSLLKNMGLAAYGTGAILDKDGR